MQRQFEILKASRNQLIQMTQELTIEQLLHIPAGLNNHIGWNFCHILVTQQSLTYGLSKKPFVLEQSVIDAFHNGTQAEANITKEFWSTMQKMAMTTVERLKSDYQNEIFDTFKAYNTSYGYPLTSIEDAITFNNLHEGVHIGYIMAQKKLLPKQSS